MNNLPDDILKYIISFCNIIDCSYLYFVDIRFNEIIYNYDICSFYQYKNIININISDFNFIKHYIQKELLHILPIGYNVNNSLQNIIKDRDFVPYSTLNTLITILKIGRSLLLSTCPFYPIENTNVNTWINIAYTKYINCLVERKNQCKNCIFPLIVQNKIKFKKL
jgi:hypothetical protein